MPGMRFVDAYHMLRASSELICRVVNTRIDLIASFSQALQGVSKNCSTFNRILKNKDNMNRLMER